MSSFYLDYHLNNPYNKELEGTMILTSPMDYESVCINGTTVQFLSGITLAVSTVNIFIFLFDLYIKYDIMSYESSHEPSKTKTIGDNSSQYEDDDVESYSQNEDNDDDDEDSDESQSQDEDQQEDDSLDEAEDKDEDEELETQSEPIKNVVNEHIVV